jgi:hypothetical protein
VSFEPANGSFCFVAAVHVGWDELECAFVGIFDGKFVGWAGFVVQDLLFEIDAVGFETSHDFVVCRNVMMVGLGLEWLDQDCIGTSVVRQHDILVAALGAD